MHAGACSGARLTLHCLRRPQRERVLGQDGHTDGHVALGALAELHLVLHHRAQAGTLSLRRKEGRRREGEISAASLPRSYTEAARCFTL